LRAGWFPRNGAELGTLLLLLLVISALPLPRRLLVIGDFEIRVNAGSTLLLLLLLLLLQHIGREISEQA
jgi:hypothetical protein